MSRAFITGSRAYGRPGLNSDVDLVVLVDEATARELIRLSEHKKEPVRFGSLNLILCVDETEYAVWRLGTRQMQRSKAKHTRDQAREVLDKLRDLAGIKDESQSGE